MGRKEKFAGSYLELFTSAMFFFIALTFLLTWLTFFSPYELFENEERLSVMNYVLITLFAFGPVMGILAGIAFDTLPLVYNIPSFEKTTMRHFLQLNAIGQVFIHVGIYSGNWNLFLELAGIGMVLMCLALLTLTSSAMDIVKQKCYARETCKFGNRTSIGCVTQLGVAGKVTHQNYFIEGSHDKDSLEPRPLGQALVTKTR